MQVVEAPTTIPISSCAPAYSASTSIVQAGSSLTAYTSSIVTDTKAALSQDTKAQSSESKEDEEPLPAYSKEGSSPLDSFIYTIAAARGAASIIT